jgi:general secretion pathway protein A
MYIKFFGLTRHPFDLSPDPHFLFATARHNEALASIVHGVSRRKGFMVLTGEVGTGKTLMVRCLMELLRTRSVATANVFNPRLRPVEFLQFINTDLGMTPASHDNKGVLLLQLYGYLISRQRANLSTVLIVDEAQNMDVELLEEIRLLTNLETAQQKLLQIVLVGQSELDQQLDSPQLRQLKQRITIRCSLEPLKDTETMAYIWRRLQRAGTDFARASEMFPAVSAATVYKYSCGIPRLINTICENALINAYARQSKAVSEEMIDEVAHELRLNIRVHAPSEIALTQQQQLLAKSVRDMMEVWEKVVSHSRVPSRMSSATKIV